MKQICMMLAAAMVAVMPTPAFAHHQSMVSAGSAQSQTSTTEQNKALARAFIEEVFNRHNPNAADKYFAKNFVDRSPWPGQTGDLAGFKAGLGAHLKAMPDFNATIKHIVAEGDKVFILSTMTGTDSGGMMGQKPTNKKMRVDTYDLVRFENGKMVEHWGTADMSQMMGAHHGHEHKEHKHEHGHDHGHDGHKH